MLLFSCRFCQTVSIRSKGLIRTNEGQEMTKEQIWALLEIYKQMQSANTMIAYGNAFEELHEFIEEHCLKVGA